MFLLERLNRLSLVFCGTSKFVSVPLLLGVASTVLLLSTFLVGQKYDSISRTIQQAWRVMSFITVRMLCEIVRLLRPLCENAP